ncbi:MAG: 2-C-methyl-D-erythritol 4-phosphate cytidylyltransferase [Candidatus Omnitrophica bacterium]|nr:2-C-methyl-D-erythritol 4-phosphate cytidylyltransferase [Candidatus Omnitrophota bacterium]
MMNVAAIIPAAGSGRRIGGTISKLFLPLNGRPLLAHTLTALQRSPSIRWIVLAIRAVDRARMEALLHRWKITKALPPCLGGGSRAESVARGVAMVPPAARWVLVHDGARPCATQALIARSVRAARRHGAVACGLPAALTVKAVDERRHVRLTLDRDQLWFAQTPQVFRRDWFAQALARAGDRLAHYPDDAALVEAAGFPVAMVAGDPANLKVTTKEDLLLAEAILASWDPRQVKRQKEKSHTTIQKSKASRALLVGAFQF